MKNVLKSGILAASMALIASEASAETTLRLAHIWPATSAVHTDIFEVWAKSVEEASNGELKVNLYPSQTLVKAAKAYDGAVSGLTDISAVVQGYTAGRFPLSEIAQLPGVTETAPQGACILQSLYDSGMIADEYADTHVLFMYSTGPAYFHTREKEVKTPADLAGLRMRRPNAVAGEMLAQMGASPVGIPAPDIYQAMERGVVDGLSFPAEAMKVFRINELTKYHVQIPYSSSIFVATMNKQSYDSLSPEMKAIIDDHSGMKWAKIAGQVFNKLDMEGLAEAEAQGDIIHVVNDPLNDPDWSTPLKQGTAKYLDDITNNGAKGAKDVYRRALELGQECAS